MRFIQSLHWFVSLAQTFFPYNLEKSFSCFSCLRIRKFYQWFIGKKTLHILFIYYLSDKLISYNKSFRRFKSFNLFRVKNLRFWERINSAKNRNNFLLLIKIEFSCILNKLSSVWWKNFQIHLGFDLIDLSAKAFWKTSENWIQKWC